MISAPVCTSQALDYTCTYYNVSLTRKQKNELLETYRNLPAFKDVEDGLTRLKSAKYRLFAFSNGTVDALETLLAAAGIREFFIDVVSVDDLKSFKPNPAVYSHFLRKSGATVSYSWLVSSNPFDVIGAISAGMRAAWVKRSQEAVYDPWGIDPTIIVGSLSELAEHIGEA